MPPHLNATQNLKGRENPHPGQIGRHDNVHYIVWRREELEELGWMNDHHTRGEVPWIDVREYLGDARVGM